jgi:hypothetical protein
MMNQMPATPRSTTGRQPEIWSSVAERMNIDQEPRARNTTPERPGRRGNRIPAVANNASQMAKPIQPVSIYAVDLPVNISGFTGNL